MSHSYSGNPANNPASITLPDDGDPPVAAAWNVPFEGLADLVAHVRDGDTIFEGNKEFTSGTVEFNSSGVIFQNVVSLLGATTNINSSGWNFTGTDPSYTRGLAGFSVDTATGSIKWPITPTVGTGGETHRFAIEGVPDLSTIVSIGARIDPANDADPTTRFRIRLMRTALDGSGTTAVATVTDPLSGGSYQAAHLFTASFNHQIDLSAYTYAVDLVGESGGDEDNVTLLCPPVITYSVPGPDWGQ